MKLNSENFPHAGYDDIVFETQDGELHKGKYGFNETNARRWIDVDGNKYDSSMVDNWWTGCVKCKEMRKRYGDNY